MLALALAGYGLTMTTLGRDDPIENCPEGETCLRLHEWPPFTAVYKAYADSSIGVYNETYRPYVTYRLEWRAVDDWTATIIDGDRYEVADGIVFDLTGSYEQVKGRTYTRFSAFPPRPNPQPEVETLDKGGYVPPPGGVFYQKWISGHDLDTRTDGETVAISADVCTGDACHEANGAEGSIGTMGLKFSDEEIANIIFTNDAMRIPVKRMGTRANPEVEVLELQVYPTEPDSGTCQTNLRRVFMSDELDSQEWDSECSSGNRTGANAHYYTFSIDSPQDFTIRAASENDDLYLYLLSGASKTGPVLDQNDNAPTSSSSGASSHHESGITRRLEAGTYTIEVTTNALAHSSGSFAVSLQSEPLAPTAIPTPTPTP